MITYTVEVSSNGTKYWFLNGKIHREDGPAIEYATGDKFWSLNGGRHRADGPAIERANGDKLWYLNSKLHREDGPAIEYADGRKFWYLDDVCLTKQEFINATQPTKELTVAEIEKLLGYKVKVVK